MWKKTKAGSFASRTDYILIQIIIFALPKLITMSAFIRFFVFVFLLHLGTSGFAQFGKIVVFAPKGEKFSLFVGKNLQNSEPASRVEADNPGGPNFKLRVAFSDPAIKEATKLVFNRPGGEFYFSLTKNSKGLYVLESAATEWSDVAKTDEGTPPPAQAAVSDNEKPKDQKQEEKPGGGCENPMSPGDFAVSLASIASAPFDGPQLSAAKKMADSHCLYASQVKEVMYVFDYESTRLSFAKYAYDHTFDRDNYDEVRDVLNSNKSKEDLKRYIDGKKK